jgi:peptide deformylase
MKLIVDKKPNGLFNPEFDKHLTHAVPKTEFTKESAEELEAILSKAIDEYGGVGISANQLGIQKRACLIKVRDTYLFLLNPQIIKRDKEGFIFYEGCLSIPKTINKPIKTLRSISVTVMTDNLGELVFSINTEGDKDEVSVETLQTVVAQHEIDHLDGITIKDRVYSTQVTKNIKYGRNDIIIMKSPDGEMVEVKYKKANDYFLNGYELV